MRKSILSVLVAMVMVACTKDSVEDVSSVELSAPDQITVGFADDTRIELNGEGKTVWTQGDYASVFYRSNANQKWQYQGETGERIGALKRVAVGTKTADISRVVVVYPYSENYYINPETCDVEATLPATQTYQKDSYGIGSNLMISSGYYNQFSLKNVLGWLKIQLKGDGQIVKSISLKGNNNEQVAGQLYINSSDATSILASDMGVADDDENGAGGGLIFDEAIIKEVTLNCPDGAELKYLAATTFYIALPPQTFSNGITITVTYADESTMVKTTSNSITIERNVIQPMEELFYDGNEVPVYQLLYTTSDNQPLAPKGEALDGVNIIDNAYDPETGYISMKFDGKVTRIPTYFLESYSTLTSVVFPDCVEVIGESAFTFCGNLKDITFGKNLTTIEHGAFSSGCSRTLNIPKSVTSIGATAFNASSNTIFYEGSLEEWCQISFGNENATGVTKRLFTTEVDGIKEVTGDITLSSVVDSSARFAFCGLNEITSVTIAEGVETVGYCAFMNCNNLRKVTMPTTLETIDDYAFKDCTNLEEINIPASLQRLGLQSFYSTNLGRIDIADLKAWCNIEHGYDGNYSLFANGAGLYLNNTLIEDLVIPDDWTKVGSYAFDNYQHLKSVVIPSSVETIESYAFSSCPNLTSITLSEGLKTLQYRAFHRSSAFTEITIPASVTNIEIEAFAFCSNLKSVVLKPTTAPTFGRYDVFRENAVGRKLYVLDYDALDSYKTTWSEYASDIEFAGIIYKAASQTSPYSYHGNFSNGATLAKNSFDEQTGTGALSFDNLIYELPSYYFCMVSAITHVTLPSTITTIERQVFDRTSISEIVIPDSVTSLGEQALSCESLTSVTLSQNLKTIEGYCFSGCRNLESISLPQTLTNIGERAFASCALLNNVVLPNLVTEIGTECFRGCGSLTNITLNEGLEIIGQSAFEGVPFEEITIPSTVTFIGNTAFHNNSNLLRVYCKPTIPPTSLKYGSAFMSYNENLVIYVPEASVDYYKNCEGDDTRKHWAYVEDIIQGYPF